MIAYLVEMFGVSLIFTIVIELTAALLLGASGKKALLLVILVNVLTNPPAVLLNWLCRLYITGYLRMPVQAVTEAAVTAAEAGIYCSFAKDTRFRIKRPVILAITANACSWLFGVILSWYHVR